MNPPIEAIKGALWWLEDGLVNAELTNAEYGRTKKYKEQLNEYLEYVANKPFKADAESQCEGCFDIADRNTAYAFCPYCGRPFRTA